MHDSDKGGSPAKHVSPLASALEFDPEGAINQVKASRAMSAQVPVLFIAPSNDYPAPLALSGVCRALSGCCRGAVTPSGVRWRPPAAEEHGC